MSALTNALRQHKTVVSFYYDVSERERTEILPYDIIKTTLQSLNLLATPAIILYYLNFSTTKKFTRLFAQDDPNLHKLNRVFEDIHDSGIRSCMISDPFERDKLRFNLTITYAQAGDIYQALENVKTLPEDKRDDARLQITLALIDFKNLERANDIAFSIQNSDHRCTALMCLSLALTNEIKIDDSQEINQTKINESLRIAAKIPKMSVNRDKCLQAIVEKLSDLKDLVLRRFAW